MECEKQKDRIGSMELSAKISTQQMTLREVRKKKKPTSCSTHVGLPLSERLPVLCQCQTQEPPPQQLNEHHWGGWPGTQLSSHSPTGPEDPAREKQNGEKMGHWCAGDPSLGRDKRTCLEQNQERQMGLKPPPGIQTQFP